MGAGKFLFPVKAMSPVFRAKMIEQMKKAELISDPNFISQLKRKKWIVYAKPPFGKVDTLIKYLAGYTFKTAITNKRIIQHQNGKVTYLYKDYRHGGVKKKMTLSDKEFLRRLSLHFLPLRFTRIRHYGILSSGWKSKLFPTVKPKPKVDWKDLWAEKGIDVVLCPTCQKGKLIAVRELKPKRGPPTDQYSTNKNNHHRFHRS